MSDPKSKESERELALADLRMWLSPGDAVYTVIRHVSRSGMSRSITPIIIKNGAPTDITYWASRALGWTIDHNHYGVKLGGCGMDMGFHLVYRLSSALFPNGFDCIGKGCPSNDHLNRVDAKHHTDGGYALRQKWL